MRHPLPRHVQVGPIPYRVVTGSDGDALIHDDAQVGITLHRRQTIGISSQLETDQVAETLLHEVLHAIWQQSALGGGREEKTVAALGPPLLDVLRRNPKLVAFLIEPEPL